MTPEAITALLVAITGMIGAMVALAVQINQYRRQVDGRMTELLNVTKKAAFARGIVSQVGDSPTEDPDSAPHTETLSGGSI